MLRSGGNLGAHLEALLVLELQLPRLVLRGRLQLSLESLLLSASGRLHSNRIARTSSVSGACCPSGTAPLPLVCAAFLAAPSSSSSSESCKSVRFEGEIQAPTSSSSFSKMPFLRSTLRISRRHLSNSLIRH